MGPHHFLFDSLGQKALDAATQLERWIRGKSTSLYRVTELIECLSSPELRDDLCMQDDLLRALNAIGIRPRTVDELNVRIGSEINGMKAATYGDMIAAKSALAFCLSLHDVVLRRGFRAFSRIME